MRILMLGAGAMGSLLGARLSKTEAEVILLGTDPVHTRFVRQFGVIVEEMDGTSHRYPLQCYDDPRNIQEKADLVIVMVKSYATREAVSSVVECCDSSTLFLTLQNGIGNWEQIADVVGKKSVLVGITAQGGTLLGPGRVRHGGNGSTFIGEIEGLPTERVNRLVKLFIDADLQTYAGEQMEQLIWEKLLINVGINAVTALTRISNGKIAELEAARSLSQKAVEEASRVAAAKGIFVPEGMVEKVFAVARATAINRSSMRQDVERGKRTEIDAINGAIVGIGEKIGIPTPVNRTLTQLIKILEATYSERSKT